MLGQSFNFFLPPRPPQPQSTPLAALRLIELRAEIVRYGVLDHIQHLSLDWVHNHKSGITGRLGMLRTPPPQSLYALRVDRMAR